MPKLTYLVRTIDKLDNRLGHLNTEVATLQKRIKDMEQTFPWDLKRLQIDLPDFLRKTYECLECGATTAEEVSMLTHRARATESAYLNQLVTLKLAAKTWNSRTVVFHINKH